MEQNLITGQDRRSFLTRAGVLALAPLAAQIAASTPAAAAPAAGKFDFDTPLNRLGTDSVHWDMPVRDEKMTKIVAGMGVADMDFRCAPAITEALQKRVAFPNWGYNMIDGDLFMGTAGNTPFVKGIIDWNRRRYGIATSIPRWSAFPPASSPASSARCRPSRPRAARC